MPEIIDRVELITTNATPRRYACGHEGPTGFSFLLYGVRRVQPTSETDAGRQQCADCQRATLQAAAARCCWCGNPILPGEAVVLYPVRDNPIPKVQGTVVDGSWLGCADCCDTLALVDGYWTAERTIKPRSSLGGR